MSADVAVVYVHGDYVRPAFMRSVIEHAVLDERVAAVKGFGPSSLLASTRNKACGWFLGHAEYRWLWFLDADIEIERDTLSKLLDVADQDEDGLTVVTGHYWGFASDGGLESVWAQMGEDGKRFRLTELPSEYPAELVGTGAGCLLISRSVLEIVSARHRDDPYRWFGHDLDENARLGEDYTFCYRALEAGFKVLGVDAPVKHHKLQAI